MNRRSFISKIVQGGTVVATGLPEKLLLSEASTVAVDKGCPYIIGPVGGGNPNPTEKLRYIFYDENYVYVGKPEADLWILRTRYETNYKKNPDDPFVHKKYFHAALLKNAKTQKINEIDIT